MDLQFPMSTVWVLILSSLICIIAPIVFLFRYNKRYDVKLSSCLIGVGGYILFGMFTVQLIHMMLFTLIPSLRDLLNTKPWVEALYNAFILVLAENIGRYFLLTYAFKNRMTVGNALLYGVGHGGIYAMTAGTSLAMGSAITTLFVNSLGAEEYLSKLGYTGEKLIDARESLIEFHNISTSQHLFDGAVPFMLFFMEIAVTIFIFYGISKNKLHIFLPLGSMFHFIVLLTYYLEKTKVITEPVLAGILILLVTLAAWHYAKKLRQLENQ